MDVNDIAVIWLRCDLFFVLSKTKVIAAKNPSNILIKNKNIYVVDCWFVVI